MDINNFNFTDKTVCEIREEITNLTLSEQEHAALAVNLANRLAEAQSHLDDLMSTGAGAEVIPVSLSIMKINAAYTTLNKK